MNLPHRRSTEAVAGRGPAGGGRREKYRDALVNPKPGQRLDTSDIDGDLIQFNIESLDARFCDDLAAYWTKVKAEVGNEKYRVRPASELDNMPKEKETGWVVELRGYTYHKRGPQLRPPTSWSSSWPSPAGARRRPPPPPARCPARRPPRPRPLPPTRSWAASATSSSTRSMTPAGSTSATPVTSPA